MIVRIVDRLLEPRAVKIWLGPDEIAYRNWNVEVTEDEIDGDLDHYVPPPVPKPTAIFTPEDMNQLVCDWLRGPMGMKGEPG